MSHCYQYLKNGEPVILSELDNQICREIFHIEPDEKRYHPAFNVVNVLISCGKTLQEIVEQPDYGYEVVLVAQWLFDNDYDTNAWREL